jgi:hypothetical protein
MRCSLRVVLALLLAVAVPSQGVVAATMGWCCPTPETVAAAVWSHPGHDHAAMMAASMQDHHEMAAHQLRSAGPLNEPGRFDVDLLHGSPHKVAKCHGHMGCCATAAIPSCSLLVDSVALKEFFAPFAPNGLAAFFTEGLERPPRLFIA